MVDLPRQMGAVQLLRQTRGDEAIKNLSNGWDVFRRCSCIGPS